MTLPPQIHMDLISMGRWTTLRSLAPKCLAAILGFALFSWVPGLHGQIITHQESEPVAHLGPALASRATGDAPGYLVQAGDVLEVDVVDVPELSRDYRVDSGGTITMPLLSSPLMARGLSLNQLSTVISHRLHAAQLVTHPHVTVAVKSSPAHAVAVAGAVRNPQLYPSLGPTTLLDVLSEAGGLAPDAGSTAIIIRGDAVTQDSGFGRPRGSSVSGAKTLEVDLRKLMTTGNSRTNVTIYPGDKITVQRAGVVYVVGAVSRPGGFPLESDHKIMTVLEAVALGEGLKSTARLNKAMIIRRGPQFPQGREEIPVNLKEVLSSHAPDPVLKPNDILFIPDSTSKAAFHRGAEAAIQIATGVIIWRR